MLRHFKYFTLYWLVSFISFSASAVDDIELAESLVEQGDCDNALPILVLLYKQNNIDQKRTLRAINNCAEKSLNYKLKESTEKKLIQLEPGDEKIKIRYLESLFYLSKYQDLISFSKQQKNLKTHDDYWMLLGRSYYEINENEKSILVFKAYLKKKSKSKIDEAYYWLVKNFIQSEDIDNAQFYLDRLLELKDITPWLQSETTALRDYLQKKNKRFSIFAKLQYGSDDNILKTNEKKADKTVLFDMYFNYKLINKSRNELSLGLDFNYQGYSSYSEYQTLSIAPRIDQIYYLFNDIKSEYSISIGKIQTNFKTDQNYYYLANYYYIPLSKSVELQPTLTYLEYTNINPIKLFNLALLVNFYLESSFFWFGPYYIASSSPAAEIDSINFSVPTVTKYSLTTSYSKAGLIFGYQKAISNEISILTQYSVAQTKYKGIDLSNYNTSQVNSFDDRVDVTQSLKISANYSYSNQWRYNLGFAYNLNNSKGFSGFNNPNVPDNNYSQTSLLLGLTYKTP